MRANRRYFVLSSTAVLSTLLLGSPLANAQSTSAGREDGRARNVILFVGDGMGQAQVQSAAYKALGASVDSNGAPSRFSFEKFPACGYLQTISANSLVTDSAAAGTALACGVKTDNAMIGVTSEEKPVPNIAELAHRSGRVVGVLSTVAFNHATPACFYAHCTERSSYDEITSQVFKLESVDVLMGGGYYGKTWTDSLLKSAGDAAGIKVFNCDNYEQLTPETVGRSRVLGYFDTNKNRQLDCEASRTVENREPHLSDMVVRALRLLQREPKGFFLMAESGAIDWACHGNNAADSIGEVIELDRTVAATVEFLPSEKALDDTLIIVTADHETGGMTIPGPYKKNLAPGAAPDVAFSTKGHTAIPVMVWASGPGSERLRGKNDNTHVFSVMADALGVER